MSSLNYVAGHLMLHFWPEFGVLQILCIYQLWIQISKYFIFLLLIKRCILTYLKINKLILTHSSKNVIVHVQAMADNSCICRNNKFTSLCSYTQINATHFFLLVPKIKSRLLFPSCVTWLVLKFCSKLL